LNWSFLNSAQNARKPPKLRPAPFQPAPNTAQWVWEWGAGMLRFVARVESGNTRVDRGIGEMSVIAAPDGPRLVAYSGTNGGVATYNVGADGRLTLIASALVPEGNGRAAETEISFAYLGGSMAILVGLASHGSLVGWASNLSGVIGRASGPAVPNGFTGRMVLADQLKPEDDLFLLATNSGRVAMFDVSHRVMIELSGFHNDLIGATELVQVTMGTQTLLLAVDAAQTSVFVYRLDPAANAVTRVETMSAGDGLAVSTLSDLDIVQAGGQTFVIATAAGTSSLTIMRLSPDGQLGLTDHVIDSRDTRFDAVCAVDTVVVGDQIFVVAGGSDDGVTLFRLLPDGTLNALATMEDTLEAGLTNVSSLEILHVGTRLFIYVGGEAESGLTVLEWQLGPMGLVIDGTAQGPVVSGSAGADILTSGAAGQALIGGAGRDVLIADTTGTRLTGGADADTFIFRSTATESTITDFQRGIDALDLTGWPMMRDVSQLTLTPRADGITAAFNGYSVTIQSSDARPLTLADILPNGLGPTRLPTFLLTANLSGGSVPGEGDGALSPGFPIPPGGGSTGGGSTGGGSTGGGTTSGGSTGGGSTGGGSTGGGATGGGVTFPTAPIERDPLGDWPIDAAWANGSTTPITMLGGAGNDMLIGASGIDFLQGGSGDDLILAGYSNDTVYSGPGNDSVFAAGGDNEIWGGPGNDVIRTRNGADMIGAGTGNDVIDGGGGANTIWGGTGNDIVMGGSGSEVLAGGAGLDAIYGYAGSDLIYCGTENDIAHGGLGADTIWGGPGDDVITGGAGDDLILAGAGTDHLWGDAGADTFTFYRNYGTTYIRDFDPAEGDEIHLVQWIFRGTIPSPDQIVQQFGRLTADGAVLDLGSANTTIHIAGITDLGLLADYLTVV
jgi:Ca2+-binding RTX toxin-like protein